MNKAPRRRFGFLDLIVLIAATAIGLRAYMVVISAYDHGPGSDFSSPRAILADIRARGLFFAPVHVTFWAIMASPFLLSWSLALAILRLRAPRPSWRRCASLPGSAACLAVVGSSAIASTIAAILALGSRLGIRMVQESIIPVVYPIAYRGYVLTCVTCGTSIGVGWMLFAVSGRWRIEKSWVDRLGVALGVAWLVLLPVLFWRSLLG